MNKRQLRKIFRYVIDTAKTGVVVLILYAFVCGYTALWLQIYY